MQVSVIIPTFGRPEQLRHSLGHLLVTRREGSLTLEIVVVDDGSPAPAQDALAGLRMPHWMSLKIHRQSNKGPAAARNRGFSLSAGDVVLFLDDDILVEPSFVARHIDNHRRAPRSVVVSDYPFLADPRSDQRLLEYMNSIGRQPHAPETELTPVDLVASGALSFERGLFAAAGRVYQDDLQVPGAEEFELSYRLRQAGIPILHDAVVKALHNRVVTMKEVSGQQFKYGIALAELVAKATIAWSIPEVAHILSENGFRKPLKEASGHPKTALKRVLAREPFRSSLASTVERLQGTLHRSLRSRAYRLVLGTYLLAGIQEGRARFGLGT